MEAAATYVIGKIDNFVATEFRLRESIEERIKELESEHEIISEVLQGENALRSQGDVIRVWFQQLQGINYDIESVVGKYAYMNATRNANPWYDRFSRMSHPIDKKIQEIEKKLMNIKDKGKSYLPHIASSSTPAAHQQGTPPLSTRDAEIVGVEGPRKELASWILDLEQAYKAMFVVGMGGSGKTALVKIVYEQLKTDFDCHVWLTASEYVHLQDLLSTMYNKLLNQTGQSSSNSSPQDLVDMLINYLRTFFSSSYKIRIPRGAILSMKLLKILHLDHANLEALPEGIKKLLLLKYLSVRDTNIKRVPISTGRLEQLETLNLKQTFVTELPESLLSLENLRHLLLGRYRMNDPWNFDVVQGVKVPKGISRLTNLQKLSFVRADKDHKLIQELQKLKKLRKLGIVDLPSESGPILCGTIEELTSLRSLSMASQNMDEVLKIHQEIDKPPLLQRLYMRGRLEMMPQWISKLHELVRIRLMWSRLPAAENPITILGKLRNLLELELLNALPREILNNPM